MSDKIKQEDVCLNCKSTLKGEYCHYCGQRKLKDQDSSFFSTLIHLVGDFVHFDSQIFRTAIPLLFKPGFLTNEFLAGKRVRYLNPVKSYVFLSFLFFFLSFSLDDNDIISKIDDDIKINDTNSTTVDTLYGDLPVVISTGKSKFNYRSIQEYDSVQHTLSKQERDGVLKRMLILKSIEIKTGKNENYLKAFLIKFIDSFKHNFPKLFFFLLPVFALLLKLLYSKSDKTYMDNLVFSMHFYNFFFLFGSIYVVLLSIKSIAAFIPNITWVPALYMIIAQKTVYQQSFGKTLIKFMLFFFLFSICVAVAMLLNILYTFITV